MELIARDICKRFGEKEVLRGASFTFEKGRIYGLLGRNGAGKTTLFNCLNRRRQDRRRQLCNLLEDDGRRGAHWRRRTSAMCSPPRWCRNF